MSYTISVSGHGASKEAVQDAFGQLLRRLADANAESGGGEPSGTASGSDAKGESFSFTAADVLHPEGDETEGEEELKLHGRSRKK